jgi:hypothetical protein
MARSAKAGLLCVLVLALTLTGSAALAQDTAAPPTLPIPDAMANQPDAGDFVSRADAALTITGIGRRFAGIGVSWLGLLQAGPGTPRMPTTYETKDVLDTVHAMASGYIRSVSLGASAGCPACLVPSMGQINQDALSHIDLVLRQARDDGIKIIIPLSGSLSACPGEGPPDPVAGFACALARWRHLDGPAFYTDAGVRAEFAAHVTRLLNHLNPLTGLAYKDDPTIMAWENCDGCGAGMDPSKLADWTEFLGRTLRATGARQLYENGAFAGRLGNGAGAIPAALVALPTVDILGDRVMPGVDPSGSGVAAAVQRVTRANRVYLIDAYGWTPAQFATEDAFEAFLQSVIKTRQITAAFLSDLSAHAEQGGNLPPGPDGQSMYFPGASTPVADEDTMQARARAVRRLSFGMQDLLPLPFLNVGRPVIVSAVHGHVVWRGAAGATTYGIARSSDITAGGSWQSVCDRCVTDAAGSWQDPSPAKEPVWYRMIPYNANDHAGMYSDPVANK